MGCLHCSVTKFKVELECVLGDTKLVPRIYTIVRVLVNCITSFLRANKIVRGKNTIFSFPYIRNIFICIHIYKAYESSNSFTVLSIQPYQITIPSRETEDFLVFCLAQFLLEYCQQSYFKACKMMVCRTPLNSPFSFLYSWLV